jgi:hypothetical protein
MALPQIEPVCWALVLQDLCCGALKPHTLAQELGIPRSTIRGWIDGQTPNHTDGERILRYWMQYTGKSREQIPTERPVFSAAR